jgi:transposase
MRSNIDLSSIKSSQVDHLPIISHYAKQMGFEKIINELVPTEMEVKPGKIVLGMVIDILSGRSPLYQLEIIFNEMDCELLLGEDLPDGYFNDDNVGRVLKHIYEAGTQKLFSSLSMAVVNAFSLPTDQVHFDTTSISLFGQYLNSQKEGSPFEINHGYSKDKRPDLKQFILSLLCVGGNIPIIGKIDSGNTSDKTINNNLLSNISKQMKNVGVEEDAFIYVADSAVVTEDNLKLMTGSHQFITRLPATYNECERVIIDAVEADQWQDIGYLAQSQPTTNRPNASYRGFNSTVTLYEQVYRAVVIHSSAHDKRRHKRLEREVISSLKSIKELARLAEKKSFACKKDAEMMAEKERLNSTGFHRMEITVTEKYRYASGRPKKGETRSPVETRYVLVVNIVEDEAALEKRRKIAGCFVLLTNIANEDGTEYTAEKVLQIYKEQNGIEKNFGFLKDDRIVNALFLKLPEHIEALGMILIIALMLWRLMERTMRNNLEINNTTLPGWNNQPTSRPTAYMLTWKFKGALIISLMTQRQVSGGLNETRLDFLAALNMTAENFINPAGSG